MKTRYIGMIVAVIAFIALVTYFAASHQHTPKGDSDHARDCWVHADRLGHRHCARS